MSSRGGFFAIDRRTWALLCKRDELTAAVAYLVLAQGTGGDNRSTSWSVESLKTHTGISFDRGTRAIRNLCAWQFIKHAESSKRTKPRYEILTFSEILAGLTPALLAQLSQWDRLLFDTIAAGKQPSQRGRHLVKAGSEAVKGLVNQGLVHFDGKRYTIPHINPEPEWLYLPNELVTGTDKGEDSPVKRLRAGGDLWTLRLLIDLYDVHNLRDDGGISPKVIREKFTREEIGQKGVYTIWGFRSEGMSAWFAGPLAVHWYRPKPGVTQMPMPSGRRLGRCRDMVSCISSRTSGRTIQAKKMPRSFTRTDSATLDH